MNARTVVDHSPARAGDADASSADTFDTLLLSMAWQVLAAFAIGLLAHAGVLALEGIRITPHASAVTIQCHPWWIANPVGRMDFGAYESGCAPKRDTSNGVSRTAG